MHVVTRNSDMSSQLMNVNNISAPAPGGVYVVGGKTTSLQDYYPLTDTPRNDSPLARGLKWIISVQAQKRNMAENAMKVLALYP